MEKENLKEYELTYLEKDSSSPFDIEKFLSGLGAKVKRIQSLGEKFLSYPIKKTTKAKVFNLVFEAEPEKLFQIERELQLEDQVLRHLILKEVISPAEKVKPALRAAEKVVESHELEKKVKMPKERRAKGEPAKKLEELEEKKRMEELEEKLGELLGESEEESKKVG